MAENNLLTKVMNLTGDQVSNVIVDVMLSVLFILTKPVILSTQVFYRNSFGERYLSMASYLAAGALIGFTATLNGVGSGLVVLPSSMAIACGFGWLAGYLVWLYIHLRFIRRRYRTGERWHSRSSGLSRWNQAYGHWLELGTTAGAFLLCLMLGLSGSAFLLFWSGILSFLAWVHEQKAFHNRVLDAIDGQIESENLSAAIEQKPIHPHNEGLKAPLPAYVSPKFRERAAEVFTSAGAPQSIVPLRLDFDPPLQREKVVP